MAQTKRDQDRAEKQLKKATRIDRRGGKFTQLWPLITVDQIAGVAKHIKGRGMIILGPGVEIRKGKNARHKIIRR